MENTKDTVEHQGYIRDPILDDIFQMLLRWENSKVIKHIDVRMLSRLISERVEMNENLSLQQDLITVLLIKQQKNEAILANFDATDREFIYRRILKRQQEALLWDEYNEPIL